MKKVSVITISYNAKDTIENTILSVINQTAFENIEYILIDGNSSDGTKDIIEKYKDKISHYVSEPDNGIYNAMNKGIRAATGDYIHFLNANDIYTDKHVVEKVIEKTRDSNADFIIGDVILVTLSGDKVPRSCKVIDRITLFTDWIYHVTLFQKRELFQKYGLFDESLKISSDAAWFIPLLQDRKITKAHVEKFIAEFSLDGVSASEYSKEDTFNELERVLSKNFRGIDDFFRRILCDPYFNKYSSRRVAHLNNLVRELNLNKTIYRFLRKLRAWQIKYEAYKSQATTNVEAENKIKTKNDFVKKDWVPSGHFYSPIPSELDVKERFDSIEYSMESVKDIDFNIEEQQKNLDLFGEFYRQIPFGESKKEGLDYSFLNDASYMHSDGICLYSMIRKVKPKRIIEIGSGYTTTLMCDVNKLFFDNTINITCIEPYAEKLKSVLSGKLEDIVTLYEKRLQEIDLNIFEKLEENDILFVDSTHISKLNSDVNKILFEILPRLKKGVHIHFHDIFFPFEYPYNWAQKGISWNEAYILRAFLMNNQSYKIEFFNTFMSYFYKNKMEQLLPLSAKNTGGSIWLRKV